MLDDANPPKFNAKAALAELVASFPAKGGRRLSFNAQCAAFAALYNHVPGTVVARAFGVTQTTVSMIGGCLERDPRPFVTRERWNALTHTMDSVTENRDINKNRNSDRIHRYRRIAEEFTRLGEDAFTERYYTDDVHIRIAQTKADIKAHEPDRRARRAGPNPTPGKWARVPFKVRRMSTPHDIVTLIVDWRDEGDLDYEDNPLPAGWTYTCIEGALPNEDKWSFSRHRTDAMAHDAAVYGYGDEVDDNGDVAPAKAGRIAEPPVKWTFRDRDGNVIT